MRTESPTREEFQQIADHFPDNKVEVHDADGKREIKGSKPS